MPPRYAYWTILVDDQPTAFRATKVEELLPTFNRLKQKNPSAVMMWSQFGKLWKSPGEAMAEGKSKDPRQSARPKPEWKPRPQASSLRTSRPQDPRPQDHHSRPKLEWKPKGTFTPAERGHSKPAWKPRPQTSSPQPSADRPKLEWKPKGSFTPAPRTHPKPEWKPRPQSSRPQDSRPRTPASAKGFGAAGQALSPKPSRPRRVPPKPGSKNWRPGGDHQDPRQKYLDAKKAKWTRFKKAIRDRHDKKGKP